ncbi:peroxiredoxin family protein [Chitinophaga nivalis]|uniref:Peroxiredoxin family protein n=1 Tax=Chitinophaga nivalis TaxID=2991709 RepID=A0ABT3IU15_9BACT|nr:peroxiredoxin family protein [Chitinophaga nivalis]MCW3462837.1 peroxiredoxin family protein [Chitinophaga nivalis]MCW3487473.1 peroxiredoxin family protein [Chitinophaga nivalis]
MSLSTSTLHRFADFLTSPIPENFPSPRRNREQINPIRSGSFFPDLLIEATRVIRGTHLLKGLKQGVELHRLASQPLVVVFYSLHWNGYADRLLQLLKDSYPAIEAAGAHVLVLSSEEQEAFLAVNPDPLPFDIVWDEENRLAKKAGIYLESDPVWGRVSGIDADVPVPAVYLVTPSLQITYDFADIFFQQEFQPEVLLSHIEKKLAISA